MVAVSRGHQLAKREAYLERLVHPRHMLMLGLDDPDDDDDTDDEDEDMDDEGDEDDDEE